MKTASKLFSVETVRRANLRLLLGGPTNLPPEVRRLMPDRETLAEAGRKAMRAMRERP